MTNIIRIKRRPAGGAAGSPALLENAELAFNEQDDTLYYGKGTGGAGGSATTIIPIAGPGAYVDLPSAQTITGAKTFSSPIAGSLAGNADTATALLTARLINGTSFNGTANITTASWGTARTISYTGDVTGSASVNGSANVGFAMTLANSGVTAGTYTKVTVDAKGRATVGAQASLNDIAAPTANYALAGFRITNLSDPVNPQDAATKAYVDATRMGLDFKESVRAATTANITLSGTQTIDGIAVVAGNRVLVKNQTTGSQNGIYVVAAGAWTRSTDADANDKVTPGMFVFVEEGTANSDSGWVLTTDGVITVGTTSLTFVQFSGAGQLVAGAGLTKTGNSIDAVGTANRITVNADSIDIASTYAGQTSITTLGTIGAGTWQGTLIGLTYGGTGRNLNSDANGSIYKKSGSQLVIATAGTDYLNNNSPIDGGTF